MSSLWDRYHKYLVRDNQLGFSLDISRMRFGNDFLDAMGPLAIWRRTIPAWASNPAIPLLPIPS